MPTTTELQQNRILTMSPGLLAGVGAGTFPLARPDGTVSFDYGFSAKGALGTSTPSGAFLSSISGLTLWVKADSLVLSDNDPVPTWADQSGGAHNFTQVTGGNQPTYKTNIINGLPAVLFDGSTSFMTGPAASSVMSTTAHTTFLVFQAVAGGASTLTPTSAFSGNALIYTPSFASYSITLGHDANNNLTKIWTNGYDGAHNGISQVINYNTPYRIVYYHDGTNINSDLNSSPFTSAALGTVTNASNLQMGDGVGFFNGYIAEYIVFNRQLTDSEIAQVDAYLASKWVGSLNGSLNVGGGYGMAAGGSITSRDITGTTQVMSGNSQALSFNNTNSTFIATSAGAITASSVNAGSGTIQTTGTGSFGPITGSSVNIGGGTVTCGTVSCSTVSCSGNVGAATFSGDGSSITNLNASALASGTVPLGRLSGITTSQLSASANIASTQLAITGVSAGTYDAATVTVNAEGQITSITAGGISGGNGVTGTANVDVYLGGGTGYRIPFATNSRHIDGDDDFIIMPGSGAQGRKIMINVSGGRSDNGQVLQVIDSPSAGLGVAYFETASSVGVDILETPFSYTGVVMRSRANSAKSASYYLYEGKSPDTDGGTELTRFSVDGLGNLTVTGAISAGTKDFVIPHPMPSLMATKNLVHTSVESPRVNLMYRGSIALTGGLATVNLDTANDMTDGTLVLLADMTTADVFLQNKTGNPNAWASISGNILTITSADANSTDVISWLVIAERKAATMPGVAFDSNGHKIVEVNK